MASKPPKDRVSLVINGSVYALAHLLYKGGDPQSTLPMPHTSPGNSRPYQGSLSIVPWDSQEKKPSGGKHSGRSYLVGGFNPSEKYFFFLLPPF